LTPLAGEDGASSMPVGFYWDGVLFIILGSIGFIGSLFTHLFIVPGWRARARAIRDSEKERQEVDDDIENDGESEKEGEEDLEEDSEDNSDDFEEDLEDDNIEESEEDYEDEESDDDDIDVGSHIGLVLDDEEVFGVIVEFDDDEGLVTIEEDGTGDLVTGYQDSMFIED
jgi:hypothetical protein